MPTNITIYAALRDEIAEGFVWLQKDGLPSRSVVKIINKGNGRFVVCEALQIDNNFLKVYNHLPRTTIDTPTSALVASSWYRAKLGSGGEALRTGEQYRLEVIGARWWNRWCWSMRAAYRDHPQLAIRVAAWLGILSACLGILSVCLGILSVVLTVEPTFAPNLVSKFGAILSAKKARTTSPGISALSVDECLDWRNKYGDLLGKPREAVIERFGPPQKEDATSLDWDANPKTGDRSVSVYFLNSAMKGSNALAVKVFAQPSESLDVLAVLKKAQMFTFDTGTYKDALTNYFIATTNDGRNNFQFDVGEGEVRFTSMMFSEVNRRQPR